MQERITEAFLTQKTKGGIPIALIFPNDYASAVANLGFNAAFMALEKCGFSCERFFYSNGEIRSMEGNKKLRNFRIWTFSISFELDVLNIFDIFSNLKVEVLGRERKGNPFVVFGGALTFFNPNSFWHVADLIFHGEIEGNVSALESLKHFFEEGLSWTEILNKMNEFEDVSVPPIGEKNVKLSKVKDLSNSFASSIMLSDQGAFGKTYLIEIERGCIHHCAFCVASKIYNIVRFMPVDEVEKRISYALKYTDKVGLIGASVSDYPKLMDLLIWLKEKVKYLSVSSLRVDAITVELLKILVSLGDREITLAPEGGTQHMRDTLNKELSAEDIAVAVKNVKDAGLKRVKLYFIYGLPGEKKEDLDGIIDMTRVVKEYGIIPYVSLNPLIPKPFTNFENFKMFSLKDLKERERYLKSSLGKYGIKSKFESVRLSRIQWVISTANKELSEMLSKSDRKMSFLQSIEKSWEGNLTWRYIDISWRNSIFDELKILKEG
ncbi:MAG: B12-binding domain-containing radical SAM protein [Thermotogae bacterium]|nr:B12-binding domain-containing radical SAM protein [Thermotogota bacterium]MCL5032683.1 B12-binding domain-containing radical SAM protein [Thermotogota bacterium]